MPDYQVAPNREHFWTTWTSGAAYPNTMHRLIMPPDRMAHYQLTHVAMDGIKCLNRGGNVALATAGLCGCTCVCLIRVRAGAGVRIAMYHKTMSERWDDLVEKFNAGGDGGHQAGDEVFLITAAEGNIIPDVSGNLLNANLNVPAANRFGYSRVVPGNMSFAIAMDRSAGELFEPFLATANEACARFAHD